MNEEINVNTIYAADCLEGLKRIKDNYVQCCVTSPPYWKLRNYGMPGQLGLEVSPEAYIDSLVEIFAEVKRVLRPDGVLWLNMGDVYWGSGKVGNNPHLQRGHREFGKVDKNVRRHGLPTTGKHPEIKAKDLVGLPWMLAFALRKQGWYLRQDIIWHKPNHMPESVTDRCTRAHEYIFLLSKNRKYYFDSEAIKTEAVGKTDHNLVSRPAKKAVDQPLVNCFRKERGPYLYANRRSVWRIANKPFAGGHFATFPIELPERCILAGSREGDIILDPFIGAGTTALAASRLKRKFIGFELNPDYVEITVDRLRKDDCSVERAILEN